MLSLRMTVSSLALCSSALCVSSLCARKGHPHSLFPVLSVQFKTKGIVAPHFIKTCSSHETKLCLMEVCRWPIFTRLSLNSVVLTILPAPYACSHILNLHINSFAIMHDREGAVNLQPPFRPVSVAPITFAVFAITLKARDHEFFAAYVYNRCVLVERLHCTPTATTY